MKKKFYVFLVLCLLLQTANSVWAINSRSLLKTAEEQLRKCEKNIDVSLEEAEKAWQIAYDCIEKTYSDRHFLNDKTYVELVNKRIELEGRLRICREQIDLKQVTVKIRSGDAEGAMLYIRKTLGSPFYKRVGIYYVGNSFYQTGKLFLKENDYEHAAACFSEAYDFLDRAIDEAETTEMRQLARTRLRDLQDSSFQLHLLRGNYSDANEALTTILNSEKAGSSYKTERYRKYKDIQDNFPMFVLTENYDDNSPEKSFELFCNLLDDRYGRKLSISEKKDYYVRAASFYDKKAQPELVNKCEVKELELVESSLKQKKIRKSERAQLEKEYAKLLDRVLERAREEKDSKTLFEFKKKSFDQHKKEFGKSDTRIMEECRENVDFFFELGDSESARSFYEEFSEIREQAKADNVSVSRNLIPFTFFMNDLMDYDLKSNKKTDDLYEPTRQEMEIGRRTSCAPKGDVDKEFKFWETYTKFVQNQDKPGEDVQGLADSLFEMIKDPVFQQYEYYQPILTLGTFYQKKDRVKEATYCANLSQDIAAFFAAPDAPESFFPIMLKAAVLKDSGNSERANAAVQSLVDSGIIQRMGRISLMNGKDDEFVLSKWPFGELDSNMNSKALYLIKTSANIQDYEFEEKITPYQPGMNPVSILVKFANQYEKSGQYTQAQLLYQFTEQFYKDYPESIELLKEITDVLEEKRKM